MTRTKLQFERLLTARQMCASGKAARLRALSGMSQADVATAAGVSRSAVAAWETGRRKPHGAGALRYLSVLERLRELS